MTTTDLVLSKFKDAIYAAYGAEIERVVLFGSRARGDANPDSDYDIAVFLNGLTDRWKEVRRIADIEVAILSETGAIIEALPHPAGSWRDTNSPLMREIRKDGRDL